MSISPKGSLSIGASQPEEQRWHPSQSIENSTRSKEEIRFRTRWKRLTSLDMLKLFPGERHHDRYSDTSFIIHYKRNRITFGNRLRRPLRLSQFICGRGEEDFNCGSGESVFNLDRSETDVFVWHDDKYRDTRKRNPTSRLRKVSLTSRFIRRPSRSRPDYSPEERRSFGSVEDTSQSLLRIVSMEIVSRKAKERKSGSRISL